MKTCFFLIVLIVLSLASQAFASSSPTPKEKVEGMILGSMIGDSFGGLTEFQVPERSRWTTEDYPLNADSIRALRDLFYMRSYNKPASPYSQWVDNALPGTITDDSRHKIILIQAIQKDPSLSSKTLAEIYIQWWRVQDKFQKLRTEWLSEYSFTAMWELGYSLSEGALPADRMFGGLATINGQMIFPPLAALFVGKPEQGYLATWKMDFLETGIAKDYSAATIAGLCQALVPGAKWGDIENAILKTDPYRFKDSLWVSRDLIRALAFAHSAVSRANKIPKRLFEIIENELGAWTWWEAKTQVAIYKR